MRISKATVYRMIQSGELPAVRFGRSYRLPRSVVPRLDPDPQEGSTATTSMNTRNPSPPKPGSDTPTPMSRSHTPTSTIPTATTATPTETARDAGFGVWKVGEDVKDAFK